MEKGTIKFKDGSEIAVEINGNSYIVDAAPSFPADLTDVVIKKEDGSEETIAFAELVECASVDGRYWFALAEIPEQIRMQRDINSKIEYLSMMTDVDIDEV